LAFSDRHVPRLCNDQAERPASQAIDLPNFFIGFGAQRIGKQAKTSQRSASSIPAFQRTTPHQHHPRAKGQFSHGLR